MTTLSALLRAMPVDTLDNIAQRENLSIDVIKIDTQGTELDILEGAQDCLASSIFMAEVEVFFLERYKHQPLCHDIVAYMQARGFELIDLYRIKRYRYLNQNGVDNISLGGGQRAGHISYSDAIFLLHEELILERLNALPQPQAQIMALKVIVSLVIYGKVDTAARFYDLYTPFMSESIRNSLAAYFKSLGKRHRFVGRKGLHLVLDYLARKV